MGGADRPPCDGPRAAVERTLLWALVGGRFDEVPDPRLSGGWMRVTRSRQRKDVASVAGAIGRSVSYVRDLERSRAALSSVELVALLADALKVPRDELVIRAVYDFRHPCDR